MKSFMPVVGATSLKKDQFNSRVYKLNGKVCKYFDTQVLHLKTNIDLLVDLGHLPNVQVENVTSDGRIIKLTYDYTTEHDGTLT